MRCEALTADYSGLPAQSAAGEFGRIAAKALGLPPYLVSRTDTGQDRSTSTVKRWGNVLAWVELIDSVASTGHGHYTIEYRGVTIDSYGRTGGAVRDLRE
jgi:hypothetical protein